MPIRVIDPDPLKRRAKPTPPGGVLPATKATKPRKFRVRMTQRDALNVYAGNRRIYGCAERFDLQVFVDRLRSLGHTVNLDRCGVPIE